MKIITQKSVQAFNNNKAIKLNNTEVRVEEGKTKLFLFGNLIAVKEGGVLKVSNAGWDSNTTKERLNALDNVHIKQKNFQWYLNGEEWNGAWRVIN